MAGLKSCIFCQRPRKMSAEHIWGNWTKDVVARTSNKHDSAYVTVMKPGEPQPPQVRTRAGDPLDATVPIVCEECNSGWMSEIQNRAKPHLTPLFRGEVCQVDRIAQSAIAAWIAMASTTGEYSTKFPGRIAVQQGDRDWLMKTQTAPKNWRIWIGRHQPLSSEPNGRPQARKAASRI